MNYEEILTRMKKAEKEALTVAEREKIRREWRALEKWLQAGAAGTPPVDVTPYLQEKGTGDLPSVSEETTSTATVGSEGKEEATIPAPGPIPELEGVAELSEAELEASLLASEEKRIQEMLKRSLQEARRYLEEGNYRSALALIREVQGRAQGELQGQAEDLAAQAQTRLNEMLEHVLEEGDAKRAEGDKEGARRAYQQALMLEPENAHARAALLALDREAEASLSQEQIRRLRAGLLERRDIHRLGEAVYEAEALQAEDRLPADLVTVLQEARETFDRMRLQHGEETTQMRFGDLEAKARVIASLEERLARGERTIWDATTNTERPTHEMLAEARALLKDASADTAQYEIALAEKFKRSRPHYVLERLQKTLQQPFQDDDRRRLEETLEEVRRWVEAKESAERLQAQAAEESDPLQRFAMYLQAQQMFEALPGLSAQIGQARLVAEETLRIRLEDWLIQAHTSLQNEEFERTYERLSHLDEEIVRWPEIEKPSSLQALQARAQALRKETEDTQAAFQEYQRLATEIRQKVQKGQKEVALALFRQVSADERFQRFRDLRILTEEMEQFKTLAEKEQDLLKARESGDWERVLSIARLALEAGGDAEKMRQFQEWEEEARLHLTLARIQSLVARDELVEANVLWTGLISQLQSRSPEKIEYVQELLKSEIEKIHQAVKGNQVMQPLYERAVRILGLEDSAEFQAFVNPEMALRQARPGADGKIHHPRMRALLDELKDSDESDCTPDELAQKVQERLLASLNTKSKEERREALRLFRHVGGMPTEKKEDLPPFALSFRAAEARRAARLVADSLRRDAFAKLRSMRAQFLGKEQELSDEELQDLASQARLLREALLLENEEEQILVRWAEVQWGQRQALQAERDAQWRQAIHVWQNLNLHYPEHPEVRRGLRRARIQHAIQRARVLYYNDHKGSDAIAVLQELRQEPEMENAWEISLVLAEIYAMMGEFDHAYGNLNHVEHLLLHLPSEIQAEVSDQVAKVRTEVEYQQAVFEYRQAALRSEQSGNTLEAIQILRTALADERVQRDPGPLKDLYEEIFQRATRTLLQKAQEEQKKGTDEGKIQAVIALVELQALEELAEVPLASRRSTRELERLRSELAMVAETVIRNANEFDPSLVPLSQALNLASELSSRLQAFDSVIPIFEEEIQAVRERLSKRRREMSTLVENLRKVKQILDQVSSPKVWETAIQNGDFGPLENHWEHIMRLELHTLPEARAFEKRLDETKEIYSLIARTIGEVKKRFGNEEYEEVVRLIVERAEQPALRANGQPWGAVYGAEYKEIYRLLGERLRIPNVYGEGELVGWEDVLHEAQVRVSNLELWQSWQKQASYKMEKLEAALRQTEAHLPSTPLRQKQADWERVLSAAQDAISLLKSTSENGVTWIGPLDDQKQIVPVRSKISRRIQNEARQWLEFAQEWLKNAEIELENLGHQLQQAGFPSEAEFADAVKYKDSARLEKLLERARQAGITNETERKRVETYARVLEQWKQEKPRRKFWDIFS